MSKIKCTVSDCKYNSNSKCNASSIEVNPNGPLSPRESKETQCETFIPNAL